MSVFWHSCNMTEPSEALLSVKDRRVINQLRGNGHCPLLGYFMCEVIKQRQVSACTHCQHPEDDLPHLIIHCPAHNQARQQTLGITASIDDMYKKPDEVIKMLRIGGRLDGCSSLYSQTKPSSSQLAATNSPSPPSSINTNQAKIDTLVDALLEVYEDEDISSLERLEKMDNLINQIKARQISPFTALEPRRQDAVEALMKWIGKYSITTKGTRLQETPQGGMGVVATEKLKADEEIVRVPYASMLSSTHGLDEFSHLIPDAIDSSWLQVPIALKLYHERMIRSERWIPYIDILPKEFPHTDFFAASDFRYLKGSISFHDCLDLWFEVSNQYCQLYRSIKKETKSRSSRCPFNTSNFTFEAYNWALGMALTRSLKIGYDADPVTALVPFWDMNNCGQENVTTSLDDETHLIAYATKSFSPGDECFVSYRDSTTSEFFTVWGLTCPGNEYSPLKVQLTSDFPLYESKIQTLKKLGYTDQTDFKVLKDEPLPLNNDSTRFLMIMFLDENDIKWPFSGTLTQTTWTKGWQALAGRLTQMLKAYPQSYHETQQLLKTSQVIENQNATFALRQVLTEQSILDSARQKSLKLSREDPPEQNTSLYQKMSSCKAVEVTVEA